MAHLRLDLGEPLGIVPEVLRRWMAAATIVGGRRPAGETEGVVSDGRGTRSGCGSRSRRRLVAEGGGAASGGEGRRGRGGLERGGRHWTERRGEAADAKRATALLVWGEILCEEIDGRRMTSGNGREREHVDECIDRWPSHRRKDMPGDHHRNNSRQNHARPRANRCIPASWLGTASVDSKDVQIVA